MADPLSRRSLFEIGTVGLAGGAPASAASGAPSSDGITSETEAVLRLLGRAMPVRLCPETGQS